jgi:hypothetical protein
MKTVKQCDYCLFVDKSESVVLVHEKECRFNPANERCQTCDNYISVDSNSFDFCKHKKVTIAEFNRSEMGLEKCGKWENKEVGR